MQNPFYGINKYMTNLRQHSTIDINIDNNFMMSIVQEGILSYYQLNYVFVGYLPG